MKWAREKEREGQQRGGERKTCSSLALLLSPLRPEKVVRTTHTHVGIPLSFLLLFDHHKGREKFLKRRSERKRGENGERRNIMWMDGVILHVLFRGA
jgi:hypothetical protein